MSWFYFVAAGCLILCVFTFFYCRFYIKRRTGRDSVLNEIQDEVDSILLRINEVTDRDISLMEDQKKSLQALMDDADRRIKVYAREMDRRANSEKAYQDLGLKMKRGGPPEEAAPLQSGPAAHSQFMQAGTQIKADPRPIREQVRDLRLAGFSAPLIASKLGISISEVELAIALLENPRE
jgi:hypothetical protein